MHHSLERTQHQYGLGLITALVLVAGAFILGAVSAWLLLAEGPPPPPPLPAPDPVVSSPVASAPPPAPPTPSPTDASVGAESKATLLSVKEILAQNATGEELLMHATQYRDNGKVGPSFLLYRAAARAGSSEAAMAIGQMYDPVGFGDRVSPFDAANPDKALDWYLTAKKAGVPNAGDAIKRTIAWVQVQANAGDAASKALLKRVNP